MKIFNPIVPGLKDELAPLWTGWQIEVGNFGYLNLLEKLGYNTKELQIEEGGIFERLAAIADYKDDFDPMEAARRMMELTKNIKFHPDFFENIKPKNTI